MKQLLSLLLLIAVFPHSATAQVKETLRFWSRNGTFCAQTIILDSTSLFFYESGCEGHASISFGKYQIGKNNKIRFHYLPFDSINPINRIIQEERVNDSSITIAFYDRYNHPLDFNFGIRLSDTSNNVHEMWTDEYGQVQVDPFLFKYVSLVQFLTMYRETEGIKIGAKSLKVYLNLPELFLTYPELQIDQPRKLSLQLQQKGLYDTKSKQQIYRRD